MPNQPNTDQTPSTIREIEFDRRFDELMGVVRQACRLFYAEKELRQQLAEQGKRLSSPWVWGFLVVAMVISIWLSEADFFEFKWEWNFGTALYLVWFLYYLGCQFERDVLRRKLDALTERLHEFEYRWDVATGGGPTSFWGLRKYIDESGGLTDDYQQWYLEFKNDLMRKVMHDDHGDIAWKEQ